MGQKSRSKKTKKVQPTIEKKKGPEATVVKSGMVRPSLVASSMNYRKERAGEFSEQMQLVRGDIRKILFLLGIVALVLVILLVISSETGLIQEAGRKVAQFMNL